MPTLTYQILHAISPNCKLAMTLVDPLNTFLPQYEITSLLRLSNFLGQAAEESDGFRVLEEYASGRDYEGRKDLGNVQSGDGVRFKGRGIFMLTGRSNYANMSKILGVDLVSTPQLASTPDLAVRIACEYWRKNDLNVLADQNNMTGITQRINGGLNGLNDRINYTNRAHTVLASQFNNITTNVDTKPNVPTTNVQEVKPKETLLESIINLI